MKAINFIKGYDLKTETESLPPVPLWLKHGMWLMGLLLAIVLVYSGLRVVRHIVYKNEYNQYLIENAHLKNEIKLMEEEATHVQKLKFFFDTHQSWMRERISVTELLIKIFEAIPASEVIQEISLKPLMSSNSNYALCVVFFREIEGEVLEDFKMNLEKSGIIFQQQSSWKSSKIEGVLTNMKESI